MRTQYLIFYSAMVILAFGLIYIGIMGIILNAPKTNIYDTDGSIVRTETK